MKLNYREDINSGQHISNYDGKVYNIWVWSVFDTEQLFHGKNPYAFIPLLT